MALIDVEATKERYRDMAIERLDYWPCACVKRDRRGVMTHIKLLPPNIRKCNVCKCRRPEGWSQQRRAKREAEAAQTRSET